MRLWTIQSPDRLEHLNRDKLIRGSWTWLRQSEDDFYIRPYKWMVKQMAERLPDVSGEAPIWAWPTKYDLRNERWRWGDGWKVCIEFDAPDDQVLKSDFDLWHNVLSDFPCTLDEAEYDEFFDRYDRRNKELIDVRGFGYRKANRWVEREFKRERERTWLRIFDPDLDLDEKWHGEGPRRWQVTLDALRLEWVREVRVFRSRNAAWP